MTEARQTRHMTLGKSAIEIGRYTYGFEGAGLKEWGEGASLKIGSFCSIASGLQVFLGGNHRVEWATTFPFGHIFQDDLGGTEITGHPCTRGDVVIGDDVWLGQNVTIMSGVQIGSGAVIAANSTIVQNVGAYEVWAGNPGRFIKGRFDKAIIARLLEIEWWTCDTAVIRKLAPVLSQTPTGATLDELQRLIGR